MIKNYSIRFNTFKDSEFSKYLWYKSCHCPGDCSDKNKRLKKFEKWYKIPKRAWKLYWKLHD